MGARLSQLEDRYFQLAATWSRPQLENPLEGSRQSSEARDAAGPSPPVSRTPGQAMVVGGDHSLPQNLWLELEAVPQQGEQQASLDSGCILSKATGQYSLELQPVTGSQMDPSSGHDFRSASTEIADTSGSSLPLHASLLEPDFTIFQKDQPSGDGKSTEVIHGARYRSAFTIFFSQLNPLHGIINENDFYQRFNRLVFDEGASRHHHEDDLFRALVYMIRAVVDLSQSFNPEIAPVPGWTYICKAEKLIQDLPRSKRLNLTMIQCLSLKAIYFTNLAQYDQVRDTVGALVRLCFQCGLHHQSAGSGGAYTAFDTVMRQRAFCCVLNLDRSIALTCRLPCLLRKEDYVFVPPELFDDRCVFPNRTSSARSPETSFIPFLVSMQTLMDIFTSVWEQIHGIKARKITTTEELAAFDHQIMSLREPLPVPLQRTSLMVPNHEYTEPFHLPQRILFHTRLNQLRLLIRHDTSLNFPPPSSVLEEIIDIASDTVHMIVPFIEIPYHKAHRYLSMCCIVNVALSLRSILKRSDLSSTILSRTRAVFATAIVSLEELSKNYPPAKRRVERLRSLVYTTGLSMNPGPLDPELLSITQTTNMDRPGSLELAIQRQDQPGGRVMEDHHEYQTRYQPELSMSQTLAPAADLEPIIFDFTSACDPDWIFTSF
ncbi:uncharacterized protein PV07_05197 [Cladophialophora immunda]|uniref:Xylanolytic transcriptional activator regulatory domain-containing protein n=1 Tax=Cladophialophora immunda TaxID=569365 RepID=A0A0D2D0Q7_9EURO|nr:uncharacterized protein PV07_05197 [Cladophialophora immunda]KIW29379.1 hypothetical protein PV07_05197 [Cladophialophora immunda]OQV10574.1 Fungal specific transcription factor domain-containing protein [Cladophialophora immunda]